MTTEEKAAKWDALDAAIGNCYFDREGKPSREESDRSVDLGTIGEIAINALGYL